MDLSAEAVWMRILSIDGGGYLGLASAAFLRGIEEHFKTSCHERFDLFCGTSTGAIIALALAKGLPAREVVGLYKRLGRAVFGSSGKFRRCWLAVKQFFVPRYDNAALRNALEDVFKNETLGDLRQRGKRIIVTAYSVTNGGPRLFKTNHSPNLTLHDNLRLCDIALASSAAPVFFPLVQLPHPSTGAPEVFCDGGIVANHPALIGFAEALSDLGKAPRDVALLSVSTPRVHLARRMGVRQRPGVIGWVLRLGLPSIMIDSNSTIAEEALKRIVKSYPEPRPLYERIALQNHEQFPMDMATTATTNALEHIGSTMAASNVVRPRLEPFFKP